MKKLFVIISLVGIIYVLGLLFDLVPLTIELSAIESHENTELDSGESFNPFANIEMIHGKSIAYVVYSWDDIQSDMNLLKGKVLYTDEAVVLDELKNYQFQYTGSDMTTVNSFFYIFVDGMLKFKSGIILEKNKVGFQNSDFGWIDNNELLNTFRKFKRCRMPVVVL